MGPSPGDVEKSEVSPDTRFVSQLPKLLTLHHFSFIFPKFTVWCAHLQNPTEIEYNFGAADVQFSMYFLFLERCIK